MEMCKEKSDPIILYGNGDSKYLIEHIGKKCYLCKKFKVGQEITVVQLLEWYLAGHIIIQRDRK